MIGDDFEAFANLDRTRKISLKLKSPGTSYVIADWEKLSPFHSDNFDSVMNFAEGGLANAWGAGTYRFSDRDLAGFPLKAGELEPYYDQLTEHIGISGTSDDLDPYFGSGRGLQPPLQLSDFCTELVSRYRAKHEIFHQEGIFIGRPRLAVLSRKLGERAEYAYDNFEFFKPHIPSVYNPAFTLRDLVRDGKVKYRSGFLAREYRETAEGVDLIGIDLTTNREETIRARKLLIGAGALSTAKIVLRSNRETALRLPILDNPTSCIPLVRPRMIGRKLQKTEGSVAQLNLIYAPRAKITGSRAPFTGPMDHFAPICFWISLFPSAPIWP